MKNLLHKTIKKHALHVVKHLKKNKHHYTVGILGSFAVVKTLLLLVGLFGILTIKNTFANYNDGLVGYWPLDANANDYSTNTNNGTILNANPIAGKVSNAYDFNGSNSYINIPNAPVLNITTAITIQAWIKRDSNPSLNSGWASIINKGADNQYRLQHTKTNT